METLLSDIRYGLRLLRKSPGFVFVAVLTLALGIGANTTIFSVMNAVLFKPLPYPDPERLAAVWESDIHDPKDRDIASWPNFEDWKRQNHVFERMAMFGSGGKGYDLAERGQEPEQAEGVRVSADFFPVLGVMPFMGRNFLPEEDQPGKDHEVVLSHGLWQRRYHADPAIIGKSIRVDGEPYTVVGVMPASFQFQFWSGPRQLWVPIGYTPGDHNRNSHSFVVFGRLKKNTTLAAAESEMDTIGRRLAQEYPHDNAGKTVRIDALQPYGMEDLRTSLIALFAAVGFVLLIACANVANLMLARGAGRQRELAMRCALGAGRWRIVRQLLTESLMLALLGGAAGLFLASSALDLLVRVLPGQFQFLPFRPLSTISMDPQVFVFTLAVSSLTGILFGLAPALTVLRTDLNDVVKQGSRGSGSGRGNRLRYILVASEVALAVIVLAGAGLMIESMARLLGVRPGFDPKNVLTMTMSLAQVDLYNGPPGNPRFCQELEEHAGTLPGVLSVSAASTLPMYGGAGRGFAIEGRPDPGDENMPGGGYTVACPHFLRTLAIPLLKGREFSERDTLNSEGVVVINEAMAREYWPKGDAVGSRIKIGGFRSDAPWLTVVGIYGDVHHRGLDQKVYPEFVRPYAQAGWPYMNIVARTASNPTSFAAPLKRALQAVEPERAAAQALTMEEIVQSSVGSRRFPMFILSCLAALALALAAVGIAGVVSYSVVQRTNEIGLRMALGARASDVLSLVLTRSMIWTMGGVLAGVAGSLAVTRLLTNLLYNVKPADPLVLTTVSVVLAAVALLASYLPARRATKVDPLVALRYE
jgi:putative ABC transport system permease protein